MAQEGRVLPYETAAERDQYDLMSDLFAILSTIDRVEKAYLRCSMSEEDYTSQCISLLARYRALYPTLQQQIGSVRAFTDRFHMGCARAIARIEKGAPETIVSGAAQGKPEGKLILEICEHGITLLDTLRLGQTSCDQVQPLLSDFLAGLNRVAPDLAHLDKLKEWLGTLGSMAAHQELDKEQARQLTFDTEKVYNAYRARLSK